VDNTALPHVPVGTVFLLDGVPPHFFRRVPAFLDREFPDGWIERGVAIPWIPRSPDFTSLDFFLLGVCKRHFLIVKISKCG
jgi:hypothetical protein